MGIFKTAAASRVVMRRTGGVSWCCLGEEMAEKLGVSEELLARRELA